MKSLSLFLLVFSSQVFASSLKDYDGRETSLTWIYSSTPKALNVKTTPDQNIKTEQVIGAAGGIISVKTADGVEYSLNFPANAVLVDTNISMIPLTSIEGIPFGEKPIGVQLEPSGLTLNKVAILTIKTPNPIPIENQIFFGFEKGGDDFNFAAPVVTSREMQIKVVHFSGYGVTKGYLADYNSIRSAVGGSIEAKLAATIAEKLGKERARELVGNVDDSNEVYSDMSVAFKEFFLKVVQPRLALLDSPNMTCAEGRLARDTVMNLSRNAQLIGFEDYNEEASKYIHLTKLDHQCMKEEYEICKEQHIFHRILPQHLQNVRMREFSSQQDPAEDQYEVEVVSKCLQFDIELNSKTEMSKNDPSFYYVVNGNVHFGFSQDMMMKLIGKGQLDITYFDAKTKNPQCSIKSDRGNTSGSFNIFNGAFTSNYDSKAQKDDLTDMKITYSVGNTKESVTMTCKNMPPFTFGQNNWFVFYVGAHRSEIEMPDPKTGSMGGLVLQNWRIYPRKELVGEKSWEFFDKKSSARDIGTARLYHRPE